MKPDDAASEKAGRVRSFPRLDDVARHAGVSTATVSRALNTPERVSDATRERVLTAVRALGYSPNFSARALAARRTHTIGAIIPTMENAIFAAIIQAFQEELRDLGFTLLIASSSYRDALEAEQVRTLAARGAEGLMLIGQQRDPAIYDFLEGQGVAVLTAWMTDPDDRIPAVGFDNFSAIRALAVEALALGHRRIGIIAPPLAENDRARERVRGVLSAVTEAGLDAAQMPLIETPYGIDTGAAALVRMMDRKAPPTLVICINDVLAVGALTGARALGLAVPRDLSITGFDDMELGGVVVPGITTVHVPQHRMGREAARMLVDLINGNPGCRQITLPTHLVIRESLGPPPAG